MLRARRRRLALRRLELRAPVSVPLPIKTDRASPCSALLLTPHSHFLPLLGSVDLGLKADSYFGKGQFARQIDARASDAFFVASKQAFWGRNAHFLSCSLCVVCSLSVDCAASSALINEVSIQDASPLATLVAAASEFPSPVPVSAASVAAPLSFLALAAAAIAALFA